MNKFTEIIHEKKPIALLIGSGISVPAPASLLSGNEFSKNIIKRISPNTAIETQLLELCDPQRKNRRNKGDFLRFEGLMQIIYDHFDPELNILDIINRSNLPNLNHFMLANLLKFGCIIFTTNFDNLLELACIELNIPFKEYLTQEDYHIQKSIDSQQTPIFKLHGSLKKYQNEWIDAKYSIKATLNSIGQSDDKLQFAPAQKRVLEEYLQNYDLIVMGYSGYDDFDIGPLLKSIPSEKRVIWINHIDNDAAESYGSWEELIQAPRDKNGDFISKHEQLLFELGENANIRNPHDILLLNIKTEKVLEFLNQKFQVPPEIDQLKSMPKGTTVVVDKNQQFFDSWAKEHLNSPGDQFLGCSMLFNSIQRVDEALDCSFQALEHFQSTNDKLKIAVCFKNIAAIYHELNDQNLFLENAKKSLEFFEAINNLDGISAIKQTLGIYYFETGKWDLALNFLNESFSLTTNATMKISTLQTIGMIYQNRGQYVEARTNYQKSLELAEKSGIIALVGNGLTLLGILSFLTGDYDAALTNFQTSLKIDKNLGNSYGIVSNMQYISQIYLKQNKIDESKAYLHKCLQIHESTKNRAGIAETFFQMGQLCDENNDRESAFTYYTNALKIDEELNNLDGVAKDFHQIGNYYSQKDFETAIDFYKKSLSISQQLGDKLHIATIYAQIGLMHKKKNNYEHAIKYLYHACKFFLKLHNPYFNEVIADLKEIKQEIGWLRFGKYYIKALQQKIPI